MGGGLCGGCYGFTVLRSGIPHARGGVSAPVANWLTTVVVLPAKSVKNRITSFNEKTGPHDVGGKPVY